MIEPPPVEPSLPPLPPLPPLPSSKAVPVPKAVKPALSPRVPPKAKTAAQAPLAQPVSSGEVVNTAQETSADVPGATATAASNTANIFKAAVDAVKSPVPSDALTQMPSELVSDVPPARFTVPASAKYNYDVTFTKSGNTNTGKAALNWRHDAGKYELALMASYFGFSVFNQTSMGQVTAQGLMPMRFSDARRNRSEVATHFNYEAQKISFSANKPDAAMQLGAQDRVSVILQIAGLLAAAPEQYPPGSTLSLQTAGSAEAEMWLFTVNPTAVLNSPSGSIAAVHVTRNPRREFDQTVELWFAPSLNYAPVRFRFTEKNGDYIDAQLQN